MILAKDQMIKPVIRVLFCIIYCLEVGMPENLHWKYRMTKKVMRGAPSSIVVNYENRKDPDKTFVK